MNESKADHCKLERYKYTNILLRIGKKKEEKKSHMPYRKEWGDNIVKKYLDMEGKSQYFLPFHIYSRTGRHDKKVLKKTRAFGFKKYSFRATNQQNNLRVEL